MTKLLVIAFVLIFLPLSPLVARDYLILQSTTSTQNSGLYDYLLPRFKEATGITVHVVAVGTGQAIHNAENCDGDVLLVHAIEDEKAFVAKGFGIYRRDVMYNDFVLVGPSDDPASVGRATSIGGALRRIVVSDAIFISRGDNSGTHKAELALWQRFGIAPDAAKFYRETGNGMGATLTIATELNAYTISDRGTWAAFANKGGHKTLFQHSPLLHNQYGVIPINPDHCPSVDSADARIFADWIVSDEGQRLIAAYRRNGQQLFFPNAK